MYVAAGKWDEAHKLSNKYMQKEDVSDMYLDKVLTLGGGRLQRLLPACVCDCAITIVHTHTLSLTLLHSPALSHLPLIADSGERA